MSTKKSESESFQTLSLALAVAPFMTKVCDMRDDTEKVTWTLWHPQAISASAGVKASGGVEALKFAKPHSFSLSLTPSLPVMLLLYI